MIWWCHRLTSFLVFGVFCSQKWQKIQYFRNFQLWESKTCLNYIHYAKVNKCRLQNNVCSSDIMDIFWYGEMLLYMTLFEPHTKMKYFIILYTIYTWKIVRRWHHQLNHLHIHIDCSRNVSSKITKIHIFLICYQICTVLFEKFYSFYWLFLKTADRISPLRDASSPSRDTPISRILTDPLA